MPYSSRICFLKNMMSFYTLYGVIQCNAKTTKSLTASLACDQNMTVYIDGKFVGTNNGTNKVVHFTLRPGTRVLAVKCFNSHGEAGILGSLDNSLVTDSRWKCKGRGTRYRKGKTWTKAYFDDTDWPQAVEYFPNRGWTFWGKMADISDTAFWIWTANKGRHDETYCRRRVSDVSVKHEKTQNGIFQATLEQVGHALLLHSRSQHEVTDVTPCAQKCRDDSRCRAFNFQHSSSSSVRQCELKDATRGQDPENYVTRSGYTYYEDV